ncbi:hypothetical protein ACH5RR_000785 [Cinchona calisaya]|uniref:Uncharacterized protein n=1 Tax=Cinchona calisaya TaxID=153742 RepID=A0ABD3B1N8_9GENT
MRIRSTNASNVVYEMDEEDDMQGLIHEALGNIIFSCSIHDIKEDFDFGLELDNDVAFDKDMKNFFKLLKHAKAELYKASQEAWYIQYPLDPKWNVVVKITPRDLFNIDPKIDINVEMQNKDGLSKHCNDDYSDYGIFPWVREGVDGDKLDALTPKSSTHIIESGDSGDDFIEDDEYFSYKDNLGYDNRNGDTRDDDDFFDEFHQGNEDDN